MPDFFETSHLGDARADVGPARSFCELATPAKQDGGGIEPNQQSRIDLFGEAKVIFVPFSDRQLRVAFGGHPRFSSVKEP